MVSWASPVYLIREQPRLKHLRKHLSEGSNFDNVFFIVDEGGSKYHHKRAIDGPPAKIHLNGVSLACQYDAPKLNAGLVAFQGFQGIRTSIAKKPYIFVIFRGGGSRPPPPSGSELAVLPVPSLFVHTG